MLTTNVSGYVFVQSVFLLYFSSREKKRGKSGNWCPNYPGIDLVELGRFSSRTIDSIDIARDHDNDARRDRRKPVPSPVKKEKKYICCGRIGGRDSVTRGQRQVRSNKKEEIVAPKRTTRRYIVFSLAAIYYFAPLNDHR